MTLRRRQPTLADAILDRLVHNCLRANAYAGAASATSGRTAKSGVVHRRRLSTGKKVDDETQVRLSD